MNVTFIAGQKVFWGAIKVQTNFEEGNCLNSLGNLLHIVKTQPFSNSTQLGLRFEVIWHASQIQQLKVVPA